MSQRRFQLRPPPGSPPTLRRILLSAVAALAVGVAVITLIGGFSPSFPVRLLQGLAIFGAGAAFRDRIVIFRDTLVRDFGRDPELLKAQVTRTVRHELAHHLGWGGRGVRGLGL